MKGQQLLDDFFVLCRRGLWRAALLGLSAATMTAVLLRAASGQEVGVVSNVKVVSDKVEDVSSIEAWRASFIKPGMTDKEKAQAVWATCVKFRHQQPPPREFLQQSAAVQDPIKTFNVYGYGMCSCVSSNIEALARAAGLKARGKGISHHSVPEVWWDGDWHMLDASLINYFLDEGGDVASVDEIIAAVNAWLDQHPDMRGNDKVLRQFCRNWGWKNGPEIFKTFAFDQNAWFPAGTHGWYSVMQDYDGSENFVYEYGYSQGYRVNVQLRQGEVLTRNWSNKGLHVNMDLGDGAPSCLTEKVGTGELRYAPKFGDIAPGRIGNGTLVYDVPVGSSAARAGALRCENLATVLPLEDLNPAAVIPLEGGKEMAFVGHDVVGTVLRVKNAVEPGVLELRMPSSYVYLGGSLKANFVVGEGGSVRVLLSRNNGLDWKEIFARTESGKSEQTIDLKPLVYRLYDYRLRFELRGAGTGLDALHIEHDVQHSQRPLPALAAGENTITFSAAAANEGTITVEGNTSPATKGNQLLASEFKPTLVGVESNERGFKMTAPKGSATFAVETPGDMTRLRLGTHYRAVDEGDGWDYLISFDDGATWVPAGSASGPTTGNCEYVSYEAVPRGVRKALVRLAGTQKKETLIYDFRIDADYVEPNGGFRPVKVTYIWDEGGAEKRDVHVASQPEETYTITCGENPLMKSLVVELAQ